MYINDETLETKYYSELKNDNPNTSMPPNGTPIILTVWFYVIPTEQPEYDKYTQKLVEGEPRKEGDEYYQVWEVVNLEGEELEEAQERKYQDDRVIQESMISEGNKVYIEDTNRTNVGANPLINDTAEYDTWMRDLYNSNDDLASTLYKPPAAERQLLKIIDEDIDNYTFTRYQDEWGWRWYLRLYRDSVNALALAIYDENGNYLYTTGALLEHPDGGWYTECPAGQADPTPEDVHYKWLLGSANISGLEVYKGSEEEKSGIVRSDERYDK